MDPNLTERSETVLNKLDELRIDSEDKEVEAFSVNLYVNMGIKNK